MSVNRLVTMYHNVAFQPASNIWVTATALHRRCSTGPKYSCALTRFTRCDTYWRMGTTNTPLSRNPASGRWLSPLWLVNGRYVTMYHNVAFQPASNIWVTATALHSRCSTVLWPSCVLTLRHAATPIGAWVQQIHTHHYIFTVTK